MNFTILHPGPFARGRVRLHLAPGLRSYPPHIEALIDAAWRQAQAQPGVELWDGPVYGLLESRVEGDTLVCRVQQTTYRAFVGTNVSHCANIADKSLLANSLACCCVCETADDHVLIGQRSQSVAEERGFWHIPGGNLDDLSAGDDAPFAQALREVEEEAHVTKRRIAALTCLGMGRNNRSWKPEFLFHARLRLTAAELRERLHLAEDAGEHVAWRLVPSNGMDEFLALHTVSPIGQAAVSLWRRLLRKETE